MIIFIKKFNYNIFNWNILFISNGFTEVFYCGIL